MGEPADIVMVEYTADFIRFLIEYGHTEEDAQGLIATRAPPGPMGLRG